jgi:hypothetical protein
MPASRRSSAMTRTPDVIADFWEWYNRRSERQDNGVADLALDKCEEAFQRCDWKGFGYWYRVYRRERGNHHPPSRLCRTRMSG